ncbi:MAG: aldolase/citrate lyase family protein [Eubacteriales bacterium]|nr:aldolase/citrate lyase family protein [Eubacteriales bacterium]
MDRVAALKKKMEEGKLVKGFFLTMADPAVSEMAGYAGYDFVWIDAEHAPLGRQEILHHIMAAQGTGCAAFVRVPGADRTQMKAILDMGPDGVIFPFTNNVEIAREEIQACLYPDQGGVRGQGPIRAIRYGLDAEDAYIASADTKVFKVGQIETVEGYENLDEILDQKGFDSFFIGRADLGRSIIGSGKDYDLDQVFGDICKRAREKGYYVGAAIGATAEDAADVKSRGVQWAVFGQDARILAEGLKGNLERLREF